jgi:hypothetical protein
MSAPPRNKGYTGNRTALAVEWECLDPVICEALLDDGHEVIDTYIWIALDAD